MFDIDQLGTHGGSLRVYAKHKRDDSKQVSDRVAEIRVREKQAGLRDVASYEAFSQAVPEIKCALLDFLIRVRRQGKRVIGYGAPAKGNTLLNYCGVGPELLEYTVDLSPHKQGHFLPGTHLPIYAPEKIEHDRPDYGLISALNLRDEISTEMAGIRSWEDSSWSRFRLLRFSDEMRFVGAEIPGVWLIEIDQLVDRRGFFGRAYCDAEFERHGLHTSYPQCRSTTQVEGPARHALSESARG